MKKAGIYIDKGLLVINYDGWSKNATFEDVEIVEKYDNKIIVKGNKVIWGMNYNILREGELIDINLVEDMFIEEVKDWKLFGQSIPYKRVMLDTFFRYKKRIPSIFESNHYLIIGE